MTTTGSGGSGMAPALHLAPMIQRLEALHDTGDYSDFVIICDDRKFKVHKAIVCPQSGFLRSLCAVNFKEGIQGEAILKEVEPSLLEEAIRFLYTGRYSDFQRTESSVNFSKGETQNEADNSYALTAVVDKHDGDDTYREEVVEIGTNASGQSTFAVQEDHPALMLNIRMYILADYLEIPLLMSEALNRCKTIMTDNFEPARFIGPLQYALDNTSGTDQELRSTIFQMCSEQREKVIACSKLDDLLTKEEPISWRLLKDQQLKYSQMVDKSEREVSNLAAEVLNLELRLRDQVHELEEAEDVIQRKQSLIEDCVKLTQKWNECRNCAIDFDVELERHRSTGDYFLRCKRCRCRHEQY